MKKVKVILDGNYSKILFQTIGKRGIRFSFRNFIENLIKKISQLENMNCVLAEAPICFLGMGNKLPKDFQNFIQEISTDGVRFAFSELDKVTGKEKDVDALIINEAYNNMPNYDYLVIFTGDHVFENVATGIRNNGKKTILVYNEVAKAADVLRESVDYSFEVRCKDSSITKQIAETPVLVCQKSQNQQQGSPKTQTTTTRNPTHTNTQVNLVSIQKMKQAINQCTKDVNGFVFLADLGAKVSVIGSLKDFLAKYSQYFQFDDKNNPFKVRIIGSQSSSQSIQQSTNTYSATARNTALSGIVAGQIENVDVNDCSGTIRTTDYGLVLFYFSDLQNPAQERKLIPGNYVKCSVFNKNNGFKVQPDTLRII